MLHGLAKVVSNFVVCSYLKRAVAESNDAILMVALTLTHA